MGGAHRDASASPPDRWNDGFAPALPLYPTYGPVTRAHTSGMRNTKHVSSVVDVALSMPPWARAISDAM